MTNVGRAVRPFHQRAVVDDEGEWNRQEIGDGPREMKAASGHERDLDAGGAGVDQRIAMRVWHASPTVQQRPIDIDCEEADHGAHCRIAGWQNCRKGSDEGPSHLPFLQSYNPTILQSQNSIKAPN